jgi:hypothetical protein
LAEAEQLRRKRSRNVAMENETQNDVNDGHPVTVESPSTEVPSEENFLVAEHLQKMPSLFARGLLYLILLFLGVGLVYSIYGKIDIVVVCPAVVRMEEGKTDLYMDIVVANRDIGLIEPGLKVRYKFHAFPPTEYGTLWGHVTSVSDSATEDKNLGFVFHVKGSFDKPYFEMNNRTYGVKPGMTGTAELEIATKSIFSVFVSGRR